MNKFCFIFLFLSTLQVCIESRKLDKTLSSASCAIDINRDLPEQQPILLSPGTANSVLPDNPEGIVQLRESQKIELFCTEGFEKKVSGSKSIQASCSNANMLQINGKKYKMTDIKCQKSSKPITKEVGKCYKNAALIHIGYNLQNRFLKLIEICFDRTEERPLYSHAILTKANAAHQKNVDRGSWVAGKGYFSNANVNKLYSVSNQMDRVKALLGASVAKKFINPKMNLARGHLAPMVDFVYGVYQRATMHLLNAAPQYNTINGGNWFRIEESVRDLVEKRDVEELDVYSGTYGTLELNKKPFYLAVNEAKQGVMPVPTIFYKVIIDRKSNQGVAIIMTNDPFISKNDVKKYVYCTDVSNKVKWVREMKPELTKGYYYACEVDDFTKVVKHLPSNVSAKSLLT